MNVGLIAIIAVLLVLILGSIAVRIQEARSRRLTEPLQTMTRMFGVLLLLGLVSRAMDALDGYGFLSRVLCANYPSVGSYGSYSPIHKIGVTGRPGVTVSINGTLQTCASHPTAGQRTLVALTQLPQTLVWAAVLLLLWQLLRTASQTGPFTAQLAAGMRRLGWLIIVGTVAAAAVRGFAADQLVNSMLKDWSNYDDVFSAPMGALFPIPALAGAALLTFARIIGAGAVMDDEIKATV